MTVLTGPHSWIEDEAGQVALPVSAPGVIGGTILRTARRSAGLSDRELARTLAVSAAAVRGWEDGTRPLFCVDYYLLNQLAAALLQAGSRVDCDTSELLLASQCDLLISGILRSFEDYAEVPPIDEDNEVGEAARGLLRWALTGTVPDRYRPYAATGPLLSWPDIAIFTAMARDLQAGSYGNDLNGYGATLLALTAP